MRRVKEPNMIVTSIIYNWVGLYKPKLDSLIGTNHAC
jgi:hypothetical protein